MTKHQQAERALHRAQREWLEQVRLAVGAVGSDSTMQGEIVRYLSAPSLVWAQNGTELMFDVAFIDAVIAAATPQRISKRKETKQAGYARFRERNLAAGLTTKGWPRLRVPDGQLPPTSERAAKRSLGQEADERAAAERAAARRAWNAKYRAKKLAAGLTTEGKPRKRAPNGSVPNPQEQGPGQVQAVAEKD